MKTLRLLLAALVPLVGGWSSCEKPVGSDPSFDLWCGDALCRWRVDSGAVQRAATWHRSDFGVELVGPQAQISQLVKTTGTSTPQCLKLEMMTDIDAKAAVTLRLDFADDGTSEFQAPVPATKWQSVSFTIRPPTWFGSVRFALQKTGEGRAVLAHLRITEAEGCSSSPLALANRPLAAPCESDAECASGKCGDAIFPYFGAGEPPHRSCVACKSKSECGAEQVCGVGTSELGMSASCTAPAAKKLGERCLTNAECGGGLFCCFQVCSACCLGNGCGASTQCAQPAQPEGYLWVSRPFVCGPGHHASPAGAACLGDQDCQSGACAGTTRLKSCWVDGRACKTDDDCPGEVRDPRHPACLDLGLQDGRCK